MINHIKKQPNIPSLRFSEFSWQWEDKELKDLLNPVIRVVPKPKENYLALWLRSHFKWVFHKPNSDPNKIAMDELYAVKENDLIVNITFAWEWAVAIAWKEDEWWLVSHRFPTYEFKKNLYVNFFRFVYPTEKTKNKLSAISPWWAWRNRVMNKRDFLSLKFKVPKDIKEQKKIADFLIVVDKKIQNLKVRKEKIEMYKKWIMKKIFSQELRFKNKTGKLFEDWKEKSLEDIGNSFNGLSWKNWADFWNGKNYITYKQIFWSSKIDISKFEKVLILKNENQNEVAYGDIFFTISSETPNEIGFASVLLDDIKECYLNSFCFWLRPKSLNTLVPEYARFFFRSDIYRKEVIKLAQWSTRYNLSKNNFMKMKFLFPWNNEQKKIANFLTEIENKIEKESLKIEKSIEFKKALLQQMFI